MKIKLILFATFLPFSIVWLLFNYQREEVNPILEFKRELYNISDKIVERVKLPNNCFPDFFAVNGENYYVYSIENKNFQVINKNKVVNVFPKKDSKDSLKLILSFIVDSNKIIGIDQISNKMVKIDTKNGVFTYESVPQFTRGIPLNDTVLLLVSIDTITRDRVFYKYNMRTNQTELLETPLPIVGDSGFANDGFFDYSDETKKLVYVLYHLGKVVTFDKYCQIIESYNTLDNYRFNPIVVQKGKRFYISRKSVMTNKAATISKNFVFIVSNMRSITDKKNGIKGEIIDIYDANLPNKYRYSVYFGDENIGNIIDIKVHRNNIYLMTNEEIININLSGLKEQ